MRAELRVDGFDGLDGGLELAGVADHVGVGEVGDDQVEGGVVDGVDNGVADAFGLHFRREIVGRDLQSTGSACGLRRERASRCRH